MRDFEDTISIPMSVGIGDSCRMWVPHPSTSVNLKLTTNLLFWSHKGEMIFFKKIFFLHFNLQDNLALRLKILWKEKTGKNKDFLFLKYFHVVNKSIFRIFDVLHWMIYFVRENGKEVSFQSWMDVPFASLIHELAKLICQAAVSQVNTFTLRAGGRHTKE